MGVDSSEPKTPPLVMVNVPPVNSSMVMVPARARAAKLPICFSISAKLELIGVAQHRHDQSAIGRDGDADVEVFVIDDVVAFDRGVDGREFLQRFDTRLGEEGHETELHAVLFLERVLVARAQFVDRLQVDLVERGEERLRRLRLDHALGDARAQPGHRHALIGASAAHACGAAGAGGGASRGARAAAGAGASLAARKFTTSDFDTRPSRPDPASALGSTLFSSATRLAAGLSLTPRRPARRRRPALDGGVAGRRPSRRLGALSPRARAIGRGHDGRRARAGNRRRFLDQRQQLTAGHGGAILELDIREYAGRRRRHFQNHFVGLQIDQILVSRDRIARLFVPRDQGGVRHRFRQLRHPHFNCHEPVLF